MRSSSAIGEVGCAGDKHFAGVGPLEKARDMQERRFAGAGRRDQRDRLARPQRKNRRRAKLRASCRRLPVAAFDLSSAERGSATWLIRNAALRPDRALPRARTDRSSPAATRPSVIDATVRTSRGSTTRGQLRQEIEFGRKRLASKSQLRSWRIASTLCATSEAEKSRRACRRRRSRRR